MLHSYLFALAKGPLMKDITLKFYLRTDCMGMMLLRIKIFFHACTPFVHSIFPAITETISFVFPKEENDQAFSVTR